MKGLGIDLVEIKRFTHWHTYSLKQLSVVFSPQEISYCLSIPRLSAERFASRFAAKEAAYKALYALCTERIAFRIFCKHVEIYNTDGMPRLRLNPHLFSCDITTHLSLTHSTLSACAVVIVE